MDIQEQLKRIQDEAMSQLERIKDKPALEDVRMRVLGKKGELTLLLRSMGQVPPEERPQVGQMINAVREKIATRLEAMEQEVKKAEQEKRLEKETIDITEPRKHVTMGSQHPISLALDQILQVFTGMGFDVVEGPEIELDHFNFELMNIPKNHPARDAQDTFYIDDNIVLRTHTSPVQARTMLSRKPPIRIVSPGRVFRADEVDATHSPVFHQIEGLVIDKDVTMADLKGTLDAFAKALYGEGVTTRFRPRRAFRAWRRARPTERRPSCPSQACAPCQRASGSSSIQWSKNSVPRHLPSRSARWVVSMLHHSSMRDRPNSFQSSK